MREYTFARRPPWLMGHVLVVVAIVVMVNLAFWQLRRLDERREANTRVVERSVTRPVDVTTLASEPIADVEFRRVTATGRFDADHEVLVGYRNSRGLPGYHVITPLVLADGRGVLVNRGFVPLAMADDWPVAAAAPPPGEVEVVGLVRRSMDARTDRLTPDSGETPVLDNIDVDVIGGHVPTRLLPVHVELQQPRPRGFPDPLPALDLGEGSHFSYAVQWFLFSAVAGVGWVALLRRRAATVNAREGHSAAGL